MPMDQLIRIDSSPPAAVQSGIIWGCFDVSTMGVEKGMALYENTE